MTRKSAGSSAVEATRDIRPDSASSRRSPVSGSPSRAEVAALATPAQQDLGHRGRDGAPGRSRPREHVALPQGHVEVGEHVQIVEALDALRAHRGPVRRAKRTKDSTSATWRSRRARRRSGSGRA